MLVPHACDSHDQMRFLAVEIHAVGVLQDHDAGAQYALLGIGGSVRNRKPHPQTGRRQLFAAQHRIDSFIFTAEDTDTEPFIDICMEMQRYITVPGIASTVISDRPSAVTNAIYDARAHADRFNIILIIGKGDERWIKDHNKHVPFEGDDRIVERMFA